MADITKVYMTWKQFDDDINDFVEFIRQYEFDSDSVILALKRGGFATAATMSNKTGIPVSTVTFQTRDGDDIKPYFLEPDLITRATKIILPDDIYDTGTTVEKTINALITDYNVPIDNIVGLFHYGSENIYSTSLNYYRVVQRNHGSWICFPWE